MNGDFREIPVTKAQACKVMVISNHEHQIHQFIADRVVHLTSFAEPLTSQNISDGQERKNDDADIVQIDFHVVLCHSPWK